MKKVSRRVNNTHQNESYAGTPQPDRVTNVRFPGKSAGNAYRIILEEMNEGAIIVSPAGLILYCNRKFSELLSLPKEYLKGSKIASYISHPDVRRFRSLLKEGHSKKSVGVISFKTTAKNLVYTQLSIAPLPRSIGGDISIVVSDITEIKMYQDQLEEIIGSRSAELKDANIQLSEDVINIRKKEKTIEAVARKYRILYNRMYESEELYKDLVESANSIIMKVDTKGNITFMNRFGLGFFGYSKEEIIGRNVTGTIIPLTDSLGKDLSHMAETVISDPDRFQINENENIRKDGSLVWVSWTNRAIRDRKGNFNSLLAIGNDITRFKETEKALVESEEKFRTIVETASEGIIIGTLDGRISYLNAKMCEMLRYSSEEIIGRKGLEFLFSGQKDKVFKTRNILKSSSLSGEFKFVRKDGSVLWTSCNASPIYDKNGIHIANLAMHTDITERKRTEEELFRSNERFKTAFDEGAIAMAITSLNGELLKVNHAFCELTGYSEHNLSGITFQKLTHPDDLATNITGFNEILTGGKSSFRMEKRYIRKGGEIIWVDISTAPVRDRIGNIEYMVTHIQDINERKKTENELRNSREKLDMALESGHIGIWERDLKSDKMVWDKRMESIFNLEHGTFRGDYSAFEELINEEDLPHYRKALRSAIENGSLFETIFRTNKRNGISKYISTKAIVNKDDKGAPVSLTGICFDVTGMKEGAEKDILKLNEELLRSNKELESFAYVASHDLQEPLRMVASFTQMLSQRYGDKLDENAREYIKYAVDGSKRMYDLINGLLAYSRVQTKGKAFSDVDMASVFDKVANNLGLILKDKSVKIRKNSLPIVFVDESQMIQLVQNLFENALKFNKSKPVIDFSSADKGDHYEFSVRDNGIGIEPQYFERIFRIFQQLMPKDEYEGTGIGLAICRRIIERHNGKIWVESVPEKGSTFFFTIPKK